MIDTIESILVPFLTEGLQKPIELIIQELKLKLKKALQTNLIITGGKTKKRKLRQSKIKSRQR
jgi:hypothetical protein